ncbi:CocE/NonD family hydrolase [Pseudorhodoferax soli]|uniref:Putative CocE/NonD family hydrolase n=1 Tax=Pseudorhodoferax soli TaxID=545864 RepID=A0A368XKV1_9BURK|nr:CocE/NonD family hydrolase [Pseudorhodoferax soli]RCW68485.1 putative CocE/NonD family hydrolase [Pseudorhodoferax soli]
MKNILIYSSIMCSALVACGGSENETEAETGATIPALYSYSRPDTFGINKTADILLPMRDGFNLTCDLYRPAVADGSLASGKFPGIVAAYHGYGRTMPPFSQVGESFIFSPALARKGYNILRCQTRGSQGTGGGSPAPQSVELVEPWQKQEQIDNYDVVEWLGAQPFSTGRIGQVGGSYSAITSLLVAGRQPSPPSLKAIVPYSGATDMYLQFAYPGGIRTAENGDARGAWAYNCSTLTGEESCSTRLPNEWAAHPTYDAYWEEQAIDPGEISAATLYINGYHDIFIAAADAITPTLNARDDFSMILGPKGHGAVGTDLKESVILAWFDKWLRQDSVPRFPKVIAFEEPVQGGQDRAYSSWPPRSVVNTTMYFQADGVLNSQPGSSHTDTYQVSDGNTSEDLLYTTQPYSEARLLAGPMNVTLDVAFSASDGNLIASVSDVSPDGTEASLGLAGYLKASHRESHKSPTPLVPNQFYSINITIPSKHWRIDAGHRLRLKISSTDSVVVSDAPAGTVSIRGGGAQASVLVLPLIESRK